MLDRILSIEKVPKYAIVFTWSIPKKLVFWIDYTTVSFHARSPGP